MRMRQRFIFYIAVSTLILAYIQWNKSSQDTDPIAEPSSSMTTEN